MPEIRACIFDLDGLLLNTEDLYLECINTILSRYGRPQLPWSVRAKYQGRPDFADCIYRWAQLPISAEQYQSERAELQRQIFPSAKPLPGVRRLLNGLRQRNVQLALATSSKRVNFELKTKHLPDVFRHFDQRRTIVGGDDRIPKGRGKPHADIFQLALKMINETLDPGTRPIDPAECLVFEDSLSGVRAAQAAAMRCIWCPHSELMVEIAANPDKFAEPTVRQAWLKGEAQGFLGRLDSLEEFDFEQYSYEVAVPTSSFAAGSRGCSGSVLV